MSESLAFRNLSQKILLGDVLTLDLPDAVAGKADLHIVSSADQTPVPPYIHHRGNQILIAAIGEVKVPALIWKQGDHELGVTPAFTLQVLDPSQSQQLETLTQKIEGLEDILKQRYTPAPSLRVYAFETVGLIGVALVVWLVGQYWFFRRIKRDRPATKSDSGVPPHGV